MEQHLFILLFFTGFTPLVHSVPRKYYLIQQQKTWSDGQAYCRATHDDLAIIESNDNMARLQKEAQRQNFSSSAWIGLYNAINSWRWSMGNETLGSMRLWTPPEPNNYAGIESCGLMYSTGWNDMPCSQSFPFVCFDGNKTGNQSYIYISNAKSWPNAQSYCRQYHTDLASDRNSTENSFILGLISGGTWFGLFRDTWKWTDQTTFSTISWMPGKPGTGNCGYLNNGQVSDAQCSAIMPFFCYSAITGRKQILRMKVQSNQDVNNPAVKVAILDQINQKLNDHVMAENITVKWREQADGKVFHKEKEEL